MIWKAILLKSGIIEKMLRYYREMDYEERKDELWLEEKEVC